MADWSRHFDEPIVLPDGGELRTLLDAGRYVDKILLLAAEGREPVRLVHVALTLALQESKR
jgi:hypothetical protein